MSRNRKRPATDMFLANTLHAHAEMTVMGYFPVFKVVANMQIQTIQEVR